MPPKRPRDPFQLAKLSDAVLLYGDQVTKLQAKIADLALRDADDRAS